MSVFRLNSKHTKTPTLMLLTILLADKMISDLLAFRISAVHLNGHWWNNSLLIWNDQRSRQWDFTASRSEPDGENRVSLIAPSENLRSLEEDKMSFSSAAFTDSPLHNHPVVLLLFEICKLTSINAKPGVGVSIPGYRSGKSHERRPASEENPLFMEDTRFSVWSQMDLKTLKKRKILLTE